MRQSGDNSNKATAKLFTHLEGGGGGRGGGGGGGTRRESLHTFIFFSICLFIQDPFYSLYVS